MNTSETSIKEVLAEMCGLVAAKPELISNAQLDDSEVAQIVKRAATATMAWVEYIAAKVNAGIPLDKEQLEGASTLAHSAEAGAYKISLGNKNATELQQYLLVFAKGLNLLLAVFPDTTKT